MRHSARYARRSAVERHAAYATRVRRALCRFAAALPCCHARAPIVFAAIACRAPATPLTLIRAMFEYATCRQNTDIFTRSRYVYALMFDATPQRECSIFATPSRATPTRYDSVYDIADDAARGFAAIYAMPPYA